LTSYVIAIGGAVGVGKSSVARLVRDRLIKSFGEPNLHNSLRLLRSDVLRKQLLDIDPLSQLPGKYYENEQYGRLIYNTLHEVARISAHADDSILLDATYARRWQRAALEAALSGVKFQGYWLDASIDERLRLAGLGLDELGDDVELLGFTESNSAFSHSQARSGHHYDWKAVRARPQSIASTPFDLKILRMRVE
jgi:predicted kinase